MRTSILRAIALAVSLAIREAGLQHGVIPIQDGTAAQEALAVEAADFQAADSRVAVTALVEAAEEEDINCIGLFSSTLFSL